MDTSEHQGLTVRHLTNTEIAAADLPHWRKLAQELHASFQAADAATASRFVTEVLGSSELSQVTGIRIIPRRTRVDLQLGWRADGRWVVEQTLDQARRISVIADRLGLSAHPCAVAQLEVALDVGDQGVVDRFWAVLLTGSADALTGDSIFDGEDLVPSFWFQQAAANRPLDLPPPEQRWHFDLWLDPEVAPERIAAAVAAGGQVVDDREAPSFTVLADANGNRVCVCTSLER